MSHKTGFYEGRLGIGLANDGGDGTGNPRFPLDVNGDIRLTGAILKANGEKYLGGLTKMGMNNMTELQNGNIGVGTDTPTVLLDISGNTKISGDLNIIGTLQMNGSSPTYSNWTNSGDDIFRDSKVTIGQGSVNTSYKLYVNGDSHVQGTLSATTLDGNLEWSKIQNPPTTIATSQSNDIVTNTGKVSSQWVTGSSSKIYYNSGNVGIGTTSPEHNLQVIKPSPGNNYALSDAITSIVADVEPTYGKFGMYFGVNQSNGWSWIQTGRSGTSTDGSTGEQFNLILQPTTGNVGIGTTDPYYKLEVKGGTGLGITYDSDHSYGIIIKMQDANYGYIQTIKQGTGYNYDLCLQPSGGNVGIGTTSPANKLEIHGGPLGLKNGNHTATTAQQILFGFSGVANLEYAHSIRTRHNGQSSANDTQNSIDFYLWKKGDTTTTIGEKHGMSITAAGVGIGTTSPSCLLNIRTDELRGTTNTTNKTMLELRSHAAQDCGTNNWNPISIDFHMSNSNNGSNIARIAALMAPTGTTHSSNSHEYCNALTFHTTTFSGSMDERMRINHNGNVGIGTTSPYCLLQVGNLGAGGNVYSETKHNRIAFPSHSHSNNRFLFANRDPDGSAACLDLHFVHNTASFNKHLMTFNNFGNVGIGTTSPGVPLEVIGSSNINVGAYHILWGSTSGDSYHQSMSGDGTHVRPISIACNNGIYSQSYIFFSSDRRIKKNIVDVPDNLALEMVRNIPCRYYEYNDTISRGNEKTIGFIAQEVKEILPMAIGVRKQIIPNEMRNLENSIWNNSTLTTDLQDVSGVKYRFFVSNDPSGNDECKKEVIGNSDNTFTFEEKWNNVFCYGKEVDDFHILDKNKLFALNFSATQELDRQQQADKAKITELENKVATLESELAAIKAHLGI